MKQSYNQVAKDNIKKELEKIASLSVAKRLETLKGIVKKLGGYQVDGLIAIDDPILESLSNELKKLEKEINGQCKSFNCKNLKDKISASKDKSYYLASTVNYDALTHDDKQDNYVKPKITMNRDIVENYYNNEINQDRQLNSINTEPMATTSLGTAMIIVGIVIGILALIKVCSNYYKNANNRSLANDNKENQSKNIKRT